jgi:hypothetical protein
MRKWIFISGITLAACKPAADRERAAEQQPIEPDTIVQEEFHDSDYGIFSFDYPVKGGLVYSLQLHFPERKAKIYPQQTGSVIQEFELGEDLNLDEGYYAEQPEALFSFTDVNFDGYADLALLRITGVANAWSDYYLFDPATKLWQFNERLSEYPNITLDEKKQLLNFHNKGGYGGAWYESGTLQWVDGVAEVVRKEEQTSGGEEDAESFIRTIWINVNGKLKVAAKVHISEIEIGERQCLMEGDWEEFDRTPFLIFAKSDEQVTRVDGRVNGCR